MPALGPSFPWGRLEADLRTRASNFTSAARRVQHRQDEEAIHDLRVSARRLTAALSLWRSLLRPGARRRATRLLRKLRRRLGGARELEVHCHLLARQLATAPTPTRVAAEATLDRMERRRDRARQRAARWTSPARVQRILRVLARAMRPTRGTGWSVISPLLDAGTRLEASARAGYVAVQTALATPDDRLLHEARIAVKKWRYAVECMRAVAPEIVAKEAPLRRLQGALGDLHDAATLRDDLRDRVKQLERRNLMEQAGALHPLIERAEMARLGELERFRALAPELHAHAAALGARGSGVGQLRAVPPAAESS